MGKQLCAALCALTVTVGCIMLSTTATAQSQTGPALVRSTASEILLLRQSPDKSDAWVFPLKISTSHNAGEEPAEIIITVSDGNYTTYETGTGLSILDHELRRVFNFHKESKSFRNGSISEAAAFAVWEWQSRARLAEVNRAMFKDKPETLEKMPMLNDIFWISHDLGLALPNAPEDGARITREGNTLQLSRENEEVATLTFSQQTVPKDVLQRVWGVIQRLRPVHPTLTSNAISHGKVPKRLRSKLYRGEEPYFIELTFEEASRTQVVYPLPAEASLVTPQAGDTGTAMMAIASRAMTGDFLSGTSEDSFWIDRFEMALGKKNLLQSFLTFYGFSLFTGDNRWSQCDQHNHMGNKRLCNLVREAIALVWQNESVGRFVGAVGAQDHKTRVAAIKFLENVREDGGEMEPLIALFIANHIEVVTRTITKSSDPAYPDRAEAEPLFLEALRAFPHMPSIYGDIATYYMNSFRADRAYFFADIGRNLPLAMAAPNQVNLFAFTQAERTLRQDFPLFF